MENHNRKRKGKSHHTLPFTVSNKMLWDVFPVVLKLLLRVNSTHHLLRSKFKTSPGAISSGLTDSQQTQTGPTTNTPTSKLRRGLRVLSFVGMQLVFMVGGCSLPSVGEGPGDIFLLYPPKVICLLIISKSAGQGLHIYRNPFAT